MTLIRFALIQLTLVALMLTSPSLWSQNGAAPEIAMDAPQKLDDAAAKEDQQADDNQAPQAKADETTAEPDSNEENQPAIGDFKPSEEISEDFPVPLPSDI